ncbi:hypothetical protein GCM10010435_17920 [Winogradskya consettensis]|uniref:Lytic transglycosylase domain-containing protein n=1 Tax=Winogradskya consettensis TaxID=113560 RepID=A0A919VWP8_9ACTN|nr:hypothetical protein Aco04nite_61130 [Actinoplanes consettensis]
MNRLWSRVGIRVASVGLLVVGTIGGVYLGQSRDVQQQGAQAQLVVQADVSTEFDEMSLLKERHSQHAAARAYQRAAEGDAASKVATDAKSAASKALTQQTKAIEKKEAEEKAAEEAAAKSSSSSSSGSSTTEVGPIPSSCSEFSGNRATGCALMLDAGFGIDQFPCLNKLFNRESGWNEKASNTSSGAYGIPQALPGSKMASVASDWETNAATQIKWGLGYIEGRYDTPCGAWDHSESVGWY